MKYIITESQRDRTIDRFISNKMNDLDKMVSKDGHSFIWVNKFDKIRLELKSSNILLVYYRIWTAISRTFSLDDDKTKEVIKNWVEEHFKLTGINPQIKLAPWKSE